MDVRAAQRDRRRQRKAAALGRARTEGPSASSVSIWWFCTATKWAATWEVGTRQGVQERSGSSGGAAAHQLLHRSTAELGGPLGYLRRRLRRRRLGALHEAPHREGGLQPEAQQELRPSQQQ